MSAELWDFLSTLKPCSWSIECNEHACNYVSAEQWILEHPSDFESVPDDEIKAMATSNVIYRLQIYPYSPGGFNFWYGASLESVVRQAISEDSASPHQ